MDFTKQDIINEGLLLLENKEQALKKLIADTRESNNDTKSSMGDKYETSREMLQQEINMLEKQLVEVVSQKQFFLKLKPDHTERVLVGALVDTSLGSFYISTGIGELNMGTRKIKTISANAPFVKALMGKQAGDAFEINGKKHQISQIY